MFSALLPVFILLGASQAWAAPCGTLNPPVTAAPKAGIESKAITVSWTNGPPAACTNSAGDHWDGTNKLRLRRAAGNIAPANPTAGTQVADMNLLAVSRDDFVGRSDKLYSYALFACEDASCSSWYADGSGSLEDETNTEASATTEAEVWVLTGVTGESDVTSVAIDDPSANAPHIFFYPSDWGSGLSNKLAIYYSERADGGSPSEVLYTIHDDTGWPASNPLNDPASWASTTLVAEGSNDLADDDYKADHPWAMLTRDGSDKRVQLFVQSQGLANNKAIQIESVDEVGDDFGLSCGGSSCSTTMLDGAGYVAIDADGTAGTDWVVHLQHSRVGWNYISDAYIDSGTDQPFMMVKMGRPAADECSDTGLYDDIGRADGAWDSGTSTWKWEVETDGGSPDCPVVHIEDGHDNTMIPLPGGEFKLYYKDWSTEEWYVTYWNGAVWEDDALITFEWDGSSSGPDHDCIENPSAVVHVDGASINEAMAFRLLDSDNCPFGGTGLDDDPFVNDAAIVFAKLSN